MTVLAKSAILMVALSVCLPAYGEILIYKHSTTCYDYERGGGTWQVGRQKRDGYLIVDVTYNQNGTISVNHSSYIRYWTENGSKWFQHGEESNLEIETVQYGGKLQWLLLVKRVSENSVSLATLAGKAYNTNIGKKDKREVAVTLKGNQLDRQDEGLPGGDLDVQTKELSLVLYSTWTKHANKEKEKGGLAENYDAAVQYVRDYLVGKGYNDQTHDVEWTRVVGSESAGVVIMGESPECWFSPTHYYLEPPDSISPDNVKQDFDGQVIEYTASGTGNGHPVETHVYGAVYNPLGQVTAFQEERYYPELGNKYRIEVSNVMYDTSGNVLDGYNVTVVRI